jgi:membrane protease YdiL (CAAX protease family)
MPVLMPVPFILLVMSIAAVWLPSVPLSHRPSFQLPPWAGVYVVAVAMAVAQGFVHASGVAALAALVGLAWAVRRTRGLAHWLAWAALLLLCLALALHRVPGFDNPVVIADARFTPGARPFSQYLNFDKGSVGLVLLALLAPRLRPGDGTGRLAIRTGATLAVTAAVVFAVAMAGGLVRFEPKAPAHAALFLIVNLFFTCVAEEAFFRVLIQDPLRGVRAGQAPATSPAWGLRGAAAAGLSALLFGLAHAGGGPLMIAMAGLAGLGYAAAYARTNRIEAPILVHFGLNAIHFLAFTYPALRA